MLCHSTQNLHHVQPLIIGLILDPIWAPRHLSSYLLWWNRVASQSQSPGVMQLWSRLLVAAALVASTIGKEVDDSKYDILPPPIPPKFMGKIGLRTNESTTSFPTPLAPPEGAPNVLLILIDDCGTLAVFLTRVCSVSQTFLGCVPRPARLLFSHKLNR